MLVTKKIKEERTNLVIDNLSSAIENEKERLERIIKKRRSLSIMDFIGNIYIFRASKNLLFEKELEKFKQDMYIYGK
ncbi:hypothetical protein HP397_06590, partial [Streptobacillus felis]|nr:hypothetical protein [Streptobacillus felis]